MKAIDIFDEYYPELKERVREVYPNFLKTAEEVEVIPWRKEFEEGDVNPEVIDTLTFFSDLFKNGLISQDEYEKEISKLLEGKYARKTLGIAFIEDKKVSFRDEVPPKNVLLHEVGHVHFGEKDPVWSASYGGGEILFHLGLEGHPIREEGVRRYMSLLKRTLCGEHEEVAREIVSAVSSRFPEVPKSFYGLCLFAGYLPNADVVPFLSRKEELFFLVPKKSDVLSFVVNLAEGIRYKDPFFLKYAECLGILRTK